MGIPFQQQQQQKQQPKVCPLYNFKFSYFNFLSESFPECYFNHPRFAAVSIIVLQLDRMSLTLDMK